MTLTSTPCPTREAPYSFVANLEAHHLDLHIPALVNAVLTEKNLLLRDGTPLIAAPSSTKNGESERDPAIHQSKKGTGGRWRWSAISASIEILACCTLGNRRVSDVNVKINKIYEINFWAYFFLQKAISYNFYHAYVCHRIRRTH